MVIKRYHDAVTQSFTSYIINPIFLCISEDLTNPFTPCYKVFIKHNTTHRCLWKGVTVWSGIYNAFIKRSDVYNTFIKSSQERIIKHYSTVIPFHNALCKAGLGDVTCYKYDFLIKLTIHSA